MFNKVGTKALLLVLVVLAGLYLLADRYSLRSQDRTFRQYVVQVDTGAVVGLTLHPRSMEGEPLHLSRTEEGWSVTGPEGRAYRADAALVHGILGQVAMLPAERMIGGILLVGERHELTDSLRNRAVFHLVDGDSVVLDIGRSTFAPSGTGSWTYVHVPGEKDVFATPGTLQMEADRALTDWRPTQLVRGEATDLVRLTFTFPGDTGYVMERRGQDWLIDGQPCDGGRVERFVESLVRSKARGFQDDADVTGVQPSHRLTVVDTTRSTPIVVTVYPWNGGFVVTSTQNPGEVMTFDAFRELPRMFREKSAFL
ncbi:MAG: DUF4340 domain-containing protein [Flavobacteriales bacterium]|nr:DUF4340 domain-containing protein [Flavobacteriales bacterium]